MKRISFTINAVVAMSVGIVVLLGYFFPSIPFRSIFLQWAVILSGIAVMLGVWNLFSVHLQKIRIRQPGSLNSLVLIFFMFLTMIFSLAPDMQPLQKVMLDGIMIPVEISLLAVLAVTLLYASVRLLRVRPGWTSILFLATTLVILLGLGPLPFYGQIPLFSVYVRPFVSGAFAAGGARGILIGVALGTLTTGVRILLGVDRPYGEG